MSRIDMLDLFKENEDESCSQVQIDVLYNFMVRPDSVIEYLDDIVEVYNTLEIYGELDSDFESILERVEDVDFLINTIMRKINYFSKNYREWDFILISPEFKQSVLKYINKKNDNFILFNNIINYYLDYFIKNQHNHKSKNALKIIKYMSKKGISDGTVTYKLNKDIIKGLKDDKLSEEQVKLLCSEDINDLRYVGKLVN